MTPDDVQPDDLDPEPEGFWTPIHAQVRAWLDDYSDDIAYPSD